MIVRKAGEKPLEYLTIEIEKVLVSSYMTGGGTGEERLIETVTLNFATVKIEYTAQSEKGGKGTTNSFNWDIPGNTKP